MLLVLIVLDLVLVVVPVAQYPAVLRPPHAGLLILEPVAFLLIYAVLVFAVSVNEAVVRNATRWGLLSGVLSGAQILQETYLHSSFRTTLTWVFVLGMFLPWLITGYQTRSTLAGVWSAILSALVTITVGWSELLWDLQGAVARNIGSPDLVRSGWTDLHAFAIVDLFQAGFKYVLVGPIIGAVLGGIGAVTRRAIRREQQA